MELGNSCVITSTLDLLHARARAGTSHIRSANSQPNGARAYSGTESAIFLFSREKRSTILLQPQYHQVVYKSSAHESSGPSSVAVLIAVSKQAT